MSEEMYKNSKREMERLLKMEGGVSAKDLAKHDKNVTKRLIEQGEAAERLGVGNTPGSFVPGMDQEDFELGAGSMQSSEEMLKAITEKAGLPFKNIQEYDLNDEEKVERLTSLIPSSTARERRVFPLDEIMTEGQKPTLVVGISDPLDVTIVDDLHLLLPEHEIEPVVLNEEDIIDAIDNHYGVGEENIGDIIDELSEEETGKKEDISGGGAEQHEINLEDLANAPPVIKLVNLILIRAIKDRASDLHVEPFQGMLRIRYRVDGVLREIPSPPQSLQLGLISRFKVMSQLNISESRRPQDGRIRLNVEGREVDLRVACVPTVHGESLVMRVLDKSAMMIGIDQLGMQKEVLESFLKRCRRPNGIILVTGPTGSGKTTTLYSSLREVYDPGTKFITTEDPVEFELPGIVQVNINQKVGLTFATCLRSILRQDPDVILVGEIRDVETAQISIQAALTGHLVLSTLHTNSASATVTRLIDMGIEPFLLTSTLEAIVGQRLLRTICPSCKAPYFPTDEELEEFGVSREEVEDISFYQGRGCDECNFTGYKGRIGVYEVMEMSDSLRELILQQATTDDIHAMAVHEGMTTLRQDGWLKICLGMTTFEEVSKTTIPETEESIRAEMESVRRSLSMLEEINKKQEEEERWGGEPQEEEERPSEDVIKLEESGEPGEEDQGPPPDESSEGSSDRNLIE